MPTIVDPQFGKVVVRRSVRARGVRIRVAPDGSLRASLPPYTPLFYVKRLLKSSRSQLQALIDESRPTINLIDGVQIGKSHSLHIRRGTTLHATREGTRIILTLPENMHADDIHAQAAAREQIIKALRIEAKAYLPKRLRYLADKYGFDYERVRFSHASGRWGSCSSSGTISLNIALMKLPFELIDYVLVHELVHTRHMNHSDAFWELVSTIEPRYKLLRKQVKHESPSV